MSATPVRRASGTITADLISVFKGTMITTLDTQVNAASANHMVDVRGAYNLVNDPDLLEVTWTPALYTGLDEAFRVPSLVMSLAGPFNW